jgi:hypothetical protein
VLDEGFFLTIAGLAMSFAGFAGLMNWNRHRPQLGDLAVALARTGSERGFARRVRVLIAGQSAREIATETDGFGAKSR